MQLWAFGSGANPSSARDERAEGGERSRRQQRFPRTRVPYTGDGSTKDQRPDQ